MRKTFKYSVEMTVDDGNGEASPTEFKDIVEFVKRQKDVRDYIEQGMLDNMSHVPNLRDVDPWYFVKVKVKKVK